MNILDPLLRAGDGRTLRHLYRLAAAVTAAEADVTGLTDAQLRARTDEFRARLAAGETETALLSEAFATVREAARRVHGMRHFDVQVIGGAAMHLGNIAEMGTGEGKTLVATLPAYLNALSGHGVHVVTVNDYLAARDGAKMGRVHEFLGLSVGIVTAGLTPEQRRAAYQCDITYGTNNEFGFDYLRDNMARTADHLVQRGHHFAIVDEVDSILIDEARTPLIISGPGRDDAAWSREFARIVTHLSRGRDYDVDEKKRTVGILAPGIAFVEDWLGTSSLYTADRAKLVAHLTQALRAKELFSRDKEYALTDGEVAIIDEHTGRIMSGRRYSDGLHQALEAKEGVEVLSEDTTYATITLQNYFRLYDTLSGMTGTGSSEAAEFHRTFGLGVVEVPPNKPSRRIDEPDVIYQTAQAKFAAVVADIQARSAAGQPVLAGTADVATSEHLSHLLTAAGVQHEVLNAKQPEREAHVVAQAGRPGAVTVATNMAGRGTDILLGGNADELAAVRAAADGIDPELDPAAYQGVLDEVRAQVASDRARVAAAGGLYVIGTERHESRRIDNQLRGRAGRQGDPGTTIFYLSLEDELVRRFAGASLSRAASVLGAGDAPIRSAMVNRAVASAQGQTENHNYEIRKDVLKYDDVLTKQRESLYANRRRVLTGHDVLAELDELAQVAGADLAAQYASGPKSRWDLEALATAASEFMPAGPGVPELTAAAAGTAEVAAALTGALRSAIAARIAALGPDRAPEFARAVMLRVIDLGWRRQLNEMTYLKEGIHLRSLAQTDPLVEYQQGAYEMFTGMLAQMRRDIVGYFINLPAPATPDAAPVQDAAEPGTLEPDGAGHADLDSGDPDSAGVDSAGVDADGVDADAETAPGKALPGPDTATGRA